MNPKQFSFVFEEMNGNLTPITVRYYSRSAFIINKKDIEFTSPEDYSDCLHVTEQLILYQEGN